MTKLTGGNREKNLKPRSHILCLAIQSGCPRPLHYDAQQGLQPATGESQVPYPSHLLHLFRAETLTTRTKRLCDVFLFIAAIARLKSGD